MTFEDEYFDSCILFTENASQYKGYFIYLDQETQKKLNISTANKLVYQRIRCDNINKCVFKTTLSMSFLNKTAPIKNKNTN